MYSDVISQQTTVHHHHSVVHSLATLHQLFIVELAFVLQVDDLTTDRTVSPTEQGNAFDYVEEVLS